MEPTEILFVDQRVVACDGGAGALGHPRVYLNLVPEGKVVCPYCGRRFILEEGAAAAAHGH